MPALISLRDGYLVKFTRAGGRTGSVAVIMALVLVVVAGFAALVIDLGYTRYVRAELQIAADAGANAATAELDGTSAGLANARAVAVAVAGLNKAAGEAVTLDGNDSNDAAGDIVTGVWDGESFTPSSSAADVNAIRVQPHRDDLSTFFSRLAFARSVMETSALATSRGIRGGAGEVACFLPIAIADCLIDDLYGSDGVLEIDLVLNPAGIDNVGWARPGANPNASWLRSQIGDCLYDGSVAVGDPIGLNNGVINAALSALADEVSASEEEWDEDLWGELPAQASRSGVSPGSYGSVYAGPILTFDDDSYCSSGGSFTGTVYVSGFVWGAIYDVITSGSASSKNIKVRLDTAGDHAAGTAAGGPDYGVQIDVPSSIVE